MKLVLHTSPNHNNRNGAVVDMVLLHATASKSTAGDIEWCCTPAPKNPKPVSYHTIVDRDGTAHQLVDVNRRAWHAGAGRFGGHTDINTYSLGLSFANLNDGKEKFTDSQYQVGAAIVASWMKLYPAITMDRITTHAVTREAWRKDHPEADKKTDPLGFDMIRFRTLVACELAKTAAA